MSGREPSDNPESDLTASAGDILAVDDNPINLVAIEAALSELGGEIVYAGSGQEALRYLLERDFALVLLDVQMPSMDGFETARLIRSRKRTEHIPIIFITAYSRDDSDVLTGYELGAVDFLFKPIRPQVLRAKASVFVALRRHAAEAARQARLLREHERREHELRLHEERQKWEAEALRQQMEEQRRAAEKMAEKAEELARTVAERERAQRALTEINQRLEEADRRKDEFIAVLAHELRNPLSPILTSLELIQARDVDDPMLVRAVEAMIRQVKHLVRLVDDLLDISRITSGKIELRTELITLQQAIAQAENMTAPLVTERAHKLRISSPDEPVHVLADPVRLAQIVSNLLTNAARYTPPAGELSVSCAIEDDQAVLRVTDNGRGIPSDALDRVFEMFTQAQRGGDGLGLGLALVDQLVKLHGGEVHAFSAGEDQGSEFTVRLPLAPSDHAAVEDHPEVELSATSLRIVLVEDDDDIRSTVRDLLTLWGHHVEVAPTGSEGVNLLLSSPPDVALVDIGLPDIDGYSVAQRIRTELGDQRPRLVAMTGYGQKRDRDRARDAGFDSHITKPATADVLRRVLSQCRPA